MSQSALRRYNSILDGKEKARYLESKMRLTSVELNSNDEDLWRAHDNSIGLGRESSGHGPSILDLKSEIARRILDRCVLCERKCGANRTAGIKGHCGVLEPRICSDFLHMGEEPDLVPSYTIFFAGCTFNCVFCQNWDISTRPESGEPVMPSTLSRKIELRSKDPFNAKNVNWVGGDPTSNLPFILDVLRSCKANIPQVWNSNMYLTEESMRLLDGVVDVYLTDFKYGNDKCALRLSNASNYMKIVKRNHAIGRSHAEMIIRHLVLPGHIDCCTRPVLNWIADNLRSVKVNVMGQYRPEFKAGQFEEISGHLRLAEFTKALEIAEGLGLDLCD